MLLHKSVQFDSRVRREASALARAGHEVTVLELAEVGGHLELAEVGGHSRSAGEATMDGFTRRSVLPPAWLRRRLPFHIYRAAFLWWFVLGIRRVRPDVVHAHDAAMLLPGILGARLTKARLVYDSHELATSVPYRERLWTMFVSAIERLAVPRCAAVITVSDGIALRLRQRYGLRHTPCVVRNVSALAPNGRSGLREHMGIAADTPLVLHQGAPAPARGCEVLVEAVENMPGVHLAFLGDPEPGYAAGLRRLIAQRNLGERVRLLPSVPLEDLLAHTAEADVGVTLLQDTCLNHRLALPNKLFEYIAAGVPVVAAALPETQRLVETHGVGWCVAPDDPIAVAGALRAALNGAPDPALRERLTRAAAELSWEREQERLLELYRWLSALGRSRSTRRRRGVRPHPRSTHPSPAGHDRGTSERHLQGGPRDHQAVAAQNGHPHQGSVPAPGAPGQGRQQRHRPHSDLAAQPLAQLAHADQAGIGVGAPHAGLPHRHPATGPQNATHLPKRPRDILAPSHGG